MISCTDRVHGARRSHTGRSCEPGRSCKLQAGKKPRATSHEPRARARRPKATGAKLQGQPPGPPAVLFPRPPTLAPPTLDPSPDPSTHPPRASAHAARGAQSSFRHTPAGCAGSWLAACGLWLAGCSWLAASSRLAASCSSFPRSAWERNIFDAPRRVAVHNPRSTEASSAGAGPCPNPTPVLPLCGLASALPLLPLRETLLHPCSSVFICGFYHPPGSEIEIEDEIEIDGVVGLRPPLYHPTTLSLYHSSPPLTPSPAPPPAPAAATPRTPPRQSPCARNRCRPRNPPTAP